MKTDTIPVVSICLCTYKRPEQLLLCLKSILAQDFGHALEVIVTDNDAMGTGKTIVDQMIAPFARQGVMLSYLVEKVQNIALARNRCVNAARGEFVAFIDDDEIASSHWLGNLYRTLIETGADGAWGPVVPVIPESFPEWMRRSRLFDRPNPEHRSAVGVNNLRTGNAMVRRSLLGMRTGPFDEAFGRTGGSDWDLFSWLHNQGFKFIWAKDAEVFECVEENRSCIRWHLVRGYRGGFVFSSKLAEDKGMIRGFCSSTGRILPAVLRSLLNLARDRRNPKAALLILVNDICGHLGKIGYFLHIKIEEYK